LPTGVICGSVMVVSGPYWNSLAIRLQDVTDGTSNTVAFSERVKGTGRNNDGQAADNQTPTGTVSAIGKVPSDPEQVYSLCIAARPGAPGIRAAALSSPGAFWHIGTMYGSRYNHVMPPNTWSCTVANTDNDGGHAASSRHPGSVNALFVDGSVKAIKGSIDRTVWRALGTRAGGEVVSASDY
jgi:prepilin-type processing-associated H-X9-DG protein